jgi:hypothetical protein
VHFHAIVRLDGPEGPTDPAPAWAIAELLEDVLYAAAAVTVTTTRPDGARLTLAWGKQIDVRRVHPDTAGELEDDTGQIAEPRLAAYIAKYATKGTGKTEAADTPIHSELDIARLKVSEHHRRIIQTAWDLGGLDQYRDLNLRRWAHMLGFRGHFLTKSRHYSTTFQVIRGDGRAYRLAETLDHLGLDPDSVLVVNDWRFQGAGYRDDAERELAAGIAHRIRDNRKRTYHQESRSPRQKWQ